MSLEMVVPILSLVCFLLRTVHSNDFIHEQGQNLALGKAAFQISTMEYVRKGVEYPGNAETAVDGNVVADGPNTTCTHTDFHVGEIWWLVDLGEIYFITEVRILPFLIGNAVRNFWIEASLFWNDTSREMIRPVICYKQSERIARGEMTRFPCYIPVMGRYIRIVKYRERLRRLNLCEVEVYGKSTVRYNVLDVRKGKRSKNPVIEAIRSTSVITCSAQCKSHEDCMSINMAIESGVCELIADPIGHEDVNEESTSAWTRYILN